MKKKSNFISAIAQTSNLNDLSKNEPKGSEILNIENDTTRVIDGVDVEEKNLIDEDTVNSTPLSVTKPDLEKKNKSKNNREFIEKILDLYKEKNPNKNLEKTSLIVTPQLHYKLKMLALSSKVNLLDLTNAILTAFLEENKEDIESLRKKLM